MEAKHKKYWFKILFGLLVHLSLLVLFIKVYMVQELGDFVKGRTTVSHRFETSDQFEFPTLSVCMDPPLKPSVASKFGLKDQQNIHWKDISNLTASDKWNEISYVLNRDFTIYMNHTKMKEGINDQFIVERLITWRFGACWTIKPRFNVKIVPLMLPFKFGYADGLKEDTPMGVKLFLTSEKSLANLVTDVWPQYEAGMVYVTFPNTQMSVYKTKYNQIISFRTFEHIYKSGVEDTEQCIVDNILKLTNCKKCSLGHGKDLPICDAENFVCVWTQFNQFRHCLFQKHTLSFEPEVSYEVTYEFEDPERHDLIRVETGLKEVLEEIEMITLSSLIGSVGGSLGMFFGFSMSSYLTFIFEKLLETF